MRDDQIYPYSSQEQQIFTQQIHYLHLCTYVTNIRNYKGLLQSIAK